MNGRGDSNASHSLLETRLPPPAVEGSSYNCITEAKEAPIL
jgi:hypothetical protein